VKLIFNKKNDSLQSTLSENENILKDQFVRKQSIRFRHKHASNQKEILNQYDEIGRNKKGNGALMQSSLYQTVQLKEQEKLNYLRREVKKIEDGLDGYEIYLLQEEINSKS